MSKFKFPKKTREFKDSLYNDILLLTLACVDAKYMAQAYARIDADHLEECLWRYRAGIIEYLDHLNTIRDHQFLNEADEYWACVKLEELNRSWPLKELGLDFITYNLISTGSWNSGNNYYGEA